MTRYDFEQMIKEVDLPSLKWMKEAIEVEMSGRVRIRLKHVYKKCNKDNCTCRYGDVEEYGHGPYIYVTWSENGRQRQKSLGRCYLKSELDRLADTPRPSVVDFIVPREQAEKNRERFDEWTLNYDDYAKYYGVYPHEDKLGRPQVVYYDRSRYEKAVSKWRETQVSGTNEFAHLGVGSPRGVRVLRSMLNRGYYL